MADLASLESAVTDAGSQVRKIKGEGGDIKPALALLTSAKEAFKVALEKAIEALAPEGDEATLADLKKKLDSVTPKSRKDKKKKAKKDKEKKAAEAAAKANGDNGGEKKMSKSQLKKLAKMQKKAQYKAAAKAERQGAAETKGNAGGKGKGKASSGKGSSGSASTSTTTRVLSGTPYAGMIAASMAGEKFTSEVDELKLPSGTVLRGSHTIARYFVQSKNLNLYGGKDVEKRCCIDQWVDFTLLHLPYSKKGLQAVDQHLETNTYVVGYTMTLADICVFGAMRASDDFDVVKSSVSLPHLSRWYKHCEKLAHFKSFKKVAPAAKTNDNNNNINNNKSNNSSDDAKKYVDKDGKPLSKSQIKKMKKAEAKAAAKAKYKAQAAADKASGKMSAKKKDSGGKLIELKDAVEGEVCTRFPPEPSGYLHIGHVKAIMLNNAMARKYKGKLIVRFDDTNPSKEKEEFAENILLDLKRLNVKPDKITYTSDSFDLIRQYAVTMIKEGNAYMDDTPGDKMSEERNEGIPSKHRDTDVKTNMKRFEAMCKGTKEGQKWCMRAKIDMQAKNKCLRDPVFYRCNLTPHHRTKTQYKAYPIYDLACPIVDSHEGVTHAMRTTEYRDRDEMYEWVLNTLKLRHVKIQEFARINFLYTLMSKRKLQKLVDEKAVDGWNDPRFPTVQGILRRGMRVQALREFILSLGFSKRVVDMTWDQIWVKNRQLVDPDAKRYFAVPKENCVKLSLTNVEIATGVSVPYHPKDPKGERCGMKVLHATPSVILGQEDCSGLAENEELTLRYYGGTVTVNKILKNANGIVISMEGTHNSDGDARKTKRKIGWVPDSEDNVEIDLHEFGHLLNVGKIPTDDVGDIVGKFEDYLSKNTHAITVAIGEPSIRLAQENEVLQIERVGFFRVDRVHISNSKKLQLFMVPDGKQKAMSTLKSKLDHV